MQLPLGPHGLRVIDVVVGPFAAAIGLAILFATIMAVFGVTSLLSLLGLPAAIQGLAILVLGLGGGCVIGFFVLLSINRRLPEAVKNSLVPDDLDEDTPDVEPSRDPDADPSTTNQRVARLDAALTPSDVVEDPRRHDS